MDRGMSVSIDGEQVMALCKHTRDYLCNYWEFSGLPVYLEPILVPFLVPRETRCCQPDHSHYSHYRHK